MRIGLPQLFYICLLMMDLGVEMSKHGQLKVRKYNAWSTLIADGIIILILLAGGFFSMN